MAPKYKDSNAYRSPEARFTRGVDATKDGLKSVWDHMCILKSPPLGVVTGLTIAIGSLGISGVNYFIQDGPTGGTERVVDYDLSGSAYMGHTYSYAQYEGTQYMLIHDEGQYELYSWNPELEGRQLIAYEIASDIIAEFVVDDRADIDGWNLSSENTYNGKRATCSIIHEAEEKEDGSITRVTNGCSWIKNQSAEGITEIYEENLAFWNQAQSEMTADNYGPLAGTVTPYEPADRSHIEPYGEILSDTAKIGFGGWLAIGMIGAGISGVRRRAEKKLNGPK